MATSTMKKTNYTRHPWTFIVLGLFSFWSAGSWLQEFTQTGRITMSRAGIPITGYSGSLAILVIVAVAILATYLLCFGVIS